MKLKEKVKSAWAKIANKHKDSELAAEEVIHEEVFPSEPHGSKKRACANKKCGCKQSAKQCSKPQSKRSRPTNGNYRMIDRDDNTCDHGKS